MTPILVAAAVLGLIAGARAAPGEPETPPSNPQAEPGTGPDKDKHDCRGKNECKGKGGCKTDKHACKGKNECKGQGGCKSSMSASMRARVVSRA